MVLKRWPARARRQFYDLHAVRPSPITKVALLRFGTLYKIEEQIRSQLQNARRRLRQSEAIPLLGDMKQWTDTTLRTLSGKSGTSMAIQYALNRWPTLVHYCSNGQIEIDNLPADRALRAVAIGRRNHLFAGSDSGGERAAAMYSRIRSARPNGIDPEAYLHYVIERIADHPVNRVHELLPGIVAVRQASTYPLIRCPHNYAL